MNPKSFCEREVSAEGAPLNASENEPIELLNHPERPAPSSDDERDRIEIIATAITRYIGRIVRYFPTKNSTTGMKATAKNFLTKSNSEINNTTPKMSAKKKPNKNLATFNACTSSFIRFFLKRTEKSSLLRM